MESGDGREYPGCVRADSLTIQSHYNKLDSLLSRLIMTVAGEDGDTAWSSSHQSSRGDFSTQLYKVRLQPGLACCVNCLIGRNISTSTPSLCPQ